MASYIPRTTLSAVTVVTAAPRKMVGKPPARATGAARRGAEVADRRAGGGHEAPRSGETSRAASGAARTRAEVPERDAADAAGGRARGSATRPASIAAAAVIAWEGRRARGSGACTFMPST
jgi:hypothetical protein